MARYLWALPNTILGLLFVPLALLARGSVRQVGGVIEIHGPLVAVVLRYAIPIHGGAAALTLGHVVLGGDRLTLDVTRAHERVHVRQHEVWGPAFIPAYLIAGLWAFLQGTGAYRGNYFECQARRLAS